MLDQSSKITNLVSGQNITIRDNHTCQLKFPLSQKIVSYDLYFFRS